MPKMIPLGQRVLVRRRKVGEKMGKLGLIYVPDSMKESDTDLAEVIFVPDSSLADKDIVDNAEPIITSMTEKAKAGDSHALDTLLKLNDFLCQKAIKEGDVVMISKYQGTMFTTSDSTQELTIVNLDDIMGVVV